MPIRVSNQVIKLTHSVNHKQPNVHIDFNYIVCICIIIMLSLLRDSLAISLAISINLIMP